MKKTIKRYHLVLPEELYNEVQQLAVKRNTTVVELMRKFVKLGLAAIHLEGDYNAHLIVRRVDPETGIVTEREIVLVW